MCVFSLSQHLSIRLVVIILLNMGSSMIGLTLTLSFFFGGFARGVIIPRWISSGYSPVSLVLFSSFAICAYSSSDPYLINSARTSSLPVALLFFSFLAALCTSSGVKGGVIMTGSTAFGVSSEENRTRKYSVRISTCSSSDVTSLNLSSYIASGFRGFRELTFLIAW